MPPAGLRPPAARPSFASASRGFTLIELLLVITILATIASLVAPRLESITNAGAEDRVTRLFGGAMLRAQDLALRAGDPVTIVIDLDAHVLRVADDEPLELPSRGVLAIAEPGLEFRSSGRVEATVDGDGFLPALRFQIGDRPVLRVHAFTAELIEEGHERR